jgi:MFS family permease
MIQTASTAPATDGATVPPSRGVWYCDVPDLPQLGDVSGRGDGQWLLSNAVFPRADTRSPTRHLLAGVLVHVAQIVQVWRHEFSAGLVSPLRLRDFRLLFAGQFISSVGDQFYLVALPWLILDRGGTPQALGLVLSAYGVPRLAALLVGGRLSDWLRPRRVMLSADIARALVLTALTMLAVLGHPPLWILCVTVAPLGLFTGLFLPASYAIAPDLVPASQLQAANAITGSSLQLARLVGPGLGGILVGRLRASTALAADALTFVVSVGTLAAIRQGRGHTQTESADVTAQADPAWGMREAEGDTEQPTAAEAGQASSVTLWHLIRQSPLLRAVLIFVGLANITSGGVIEVALPGYTHGPLAAGATGYGLILGAWGAGALLGGVAAGGLGRVRHKGRLMLLVTLGEGAGIALTPLAGHLFGLSGVVLDLGAFGVANGLSNVLLISLVQQSFPRHLLGRIMGAFLLAAYGIYPLSVALGGLVTQHIGAVAMFLLAGSALLGAVLYAWVQGALQAM